MGEEKVYDNVVYKDAPGTLTVNDKIFHFQAKTAKASVKVSWAKVQKRQLSPESAAKPMIRLMLFSGKDVVLEVENRDILEDLRSDIQNRMENAALSGEDLESGGGGTDIDEKSADWQDEIQDPKSGNKRVTRTTTTTTTKTTRMPPPEEKPDNRRSCLYCCFGSLVCWICMCLCFLLIVAIVLIVVYFGILKDDGKEILENVGIINKRNESIPPDWGFEDRYGIREVTYEWEEEALTLKYKVSDYILDDSVDFILYDGEKCRRGAKDITESDPHLFIDVIPPTDSGPNLNNNGRGDRLFKINVQFNKEAITDASYYNAFGLNSARMTFCIGYSIMYNRVDYWEKELEVNYVENAVQLDIDRERIFAIQDVRIKAIVKPLYYRN